MRALEDHRKVIIISLIILILVSFCELLGLRFGIISREMSRVGLGVILAPPLFVSCLFCVLWHESWFKKKKTNLLNNLKKVFFWTVAIAILLAWSGIYIQFVF